MKKYEIAIAAAIFFALGYYVAIKIAEIQMIVDV